ncbi:MAG TPA: coenzyme F420-0:L-glutamate ligase [Candidatus Limnocylindrales bacterium]
MPPVVEVYAIEGLPEVEAGADLPGLIAEALAAAATADPRLGPLRPEDVIVVTSKVVSKAEGAVVDLRTVEPRPEAVAFAERWNRDPRQVEVVLREARRVVRMANGVIITETPHGFVCANGGIDASNVGPRSGDVVLLLPRDPDASAAAIRAAVREATGADVPVIVSDTFGRPWRWGVTDVAIGLSGIAPLDDLRDTKDADGRVMRSTIRAVADEIASAAELALGKVGRRPVAVVRGASPSRAEAAIVDVLIPAASDLFR